MNQNQFTHLRKRAVITKLETETTAAMMTDYKSINAAKRESRSLSKGKSQAVVRVVK